MAERAPSLWESFIVQIGGEWASRTWGEYMGIAIDAYRTPRRDLPPFRPGLGRDLALSHAIRAVKRNRKQRIARRGADEEVED